MFQECLFENCGFIAGYLRGFRVGLHYGPGRMGAFKLHERPGPGRPFNYTKARCISIFFKTVNTLFEIEIEKRFSPLAASPSHLSCLVPP